MTGSQAAMGAPGLFDPKTWSGSPYAVVAGRDLICFVREPGDVSDDELRARVNAPPDTYVMRQCPSLDTDLITWTCHVCGRERLDQFISVAKRPAAGMQDVLPGQVYNVRYCNDCPSCAEAAWTAPQWPPAAAGLVCIPARGLHAEPHKGCAAAGDVPVDET